MDANTKELIPGDTERTVQQMSLNFDWLLARLDEIHDALCPDHLGTWQQRVEKTVEAAKAIEAERLRENAR